MSYLGVGQGVGAGGELTSSEEIFVQNIVGLPYVKGDILYHNGLIITRLPIGTSGQLLSISNGIPNWADESTIGAGTVTIVSIVSANGISGIVSNATTIPAITLTLGAITPTSVNGLIFSGTANSSVAFGTGGTVTYTSNNLSIFAATTSAQLAGIISDETGSAGKLVFDTAPTLSTVTLNGTVPLTLTQTVATNGSPNGFIFTGAAHTTLSASTEAIDFNINAARIVQFATGALATQRAIYIQAPTYAFVGASTITTAVTLAISGGPVVGTNATITRSLALSIESGDARFSGNILFNGGTSSLTVIGTAATTNGLTIQGNITAGGAGPELKVRGSTGRTAGDLFQVQNNTTNKFVVAWDGGITCSQSPNSSGSPSFWKLNAGSHTSLTASVEAVDLDLNLGRTVQFAQGSLSLQRAVNISAPTYAFATGAATITTAVTMEISSAPSMGTNATATLAYGLRVGGATTQVSASGFIYQAINVPSHTLTITGTTQVTSTSIAGVGIGQLTLTDASALTVNNAASLYISAAPIAAGSVTLTNSYSFWVDGGNTRLDGNLMLGSAVTGATAANGVLAMSNGATAPTNSVDLVHLYAADLSAGNASLAIYTETAVATDVSLVSTNSITVFVNGVKYKIPLVAA